MVVDKAPKILLFWGLVMSLQGLVAGETLVSSFPDVEEEFLSAFEGEICFTFDIFGFEFCMPDFIGIIAAFLTFPFQVLIFLWDFLTLGFIEGMPIWVTLPVQVAMGGVLAILAFVLLPPMVRAIGDLIPTT